MEINLDKGQILHLINGKSCSGKTTLAKNILENTKINTFLIPGDKFLNFFSLDIYDLNKIRIPVQGERISIFYDKDNISISPFKNSNEYNRIMKKNKYAEKNKDFSPDNNLMIVDDIENISYKTLEIVDKSLRLLFDPKKFFGGTNLIFLGNSKPKITFENIFSSSLYNNDKNFYKLFKFQRLNRLTKFSQQFPSLEYNNLFSFDLDLRDLDKINILEKKEREFFKSRDVEYYRQDLENEMHFASNYETSRDHNMEELGKLDYEQLYIIQPFKKEMTEELSKRCKKIIEPLIICQGAKIIFISDIPEINIKKGDIGFIDKINTTKTEKINKDNFVPNTNINWSEVIEINTEEEIKDIQVKVNGKLKIISLKNYIIQNKTNSTVLRFPFVLGWCSNNVVPCSKAVCILSEDISIHFIESCINKIEDIGFKYSSLVHLLNFVKLSFSDSIKNGYKHNN